MTVFGKNHRYRNGELCRIVNYEPEYNGKEVVYSHRDGDYHYVWCNGYELELLRNELEPIQFKEDIKPSFDEDLFHV